MVDKHMKPALDAAGNHRSDWLFQDWIYGTGVPKYHLEYTVKPADGGKVAFEGKADAERRPAGFPDDRAAVFRLRWALDRGRPCAGNRGFDLAVKVTLPKAPKRVSINANHDLLASEISVKKL